jgi:hypothetical protein
MRWPETTEGFCQGFAGFRKSVINICLISGLLLFSCLFKTLSSPDSLACESSILLVACTTKRIFFDMQQFLGYALNLFASATPQCTNGFRQNKE